MGTLTTTSQSLNTQAEYTGDSLKINVSYTEDATTSTLQSLNGKIFHASDNTYAGNFNGSLNGTEIEYSLSGVKSKDFTIVISAIEDIERIIKENEQPVDAE